MEEPNRLMASQISDKTEAHCLEFLRILEEVAGANIGTVGSDRMLRAEGLFVKFHHHAMSAMVMRNGTPVPNTNHVFVDFGSFNILVRSAVEATLLFSYLYSKELSTEEAECRFAAWKLADLQMRLDLPSPSEAFEEALAADRKEMAELCESLGKNPIFKDLKSDRQKAILAGSASKWRLKGWKNIGKDMGLSDITAENLYAYLSSYAHSGYISVKQTWLAKDPAIRRRLMNTGVSMLTICLAHMARMYSDLFPPVKERLQAIDNAAKLMQLWIEVGAG